jgi:hypothetical protein
LAVGSFYKEVLMTEVIELARFVVREGEEESFLAKRGPMLCAVSRKFRGLRRLELVKLDDGSWIDIAVWENPEQRAEALRIADEVPEIADWFAHIERDISNQFGTIYDRVGTAA